MAENIKKSEKMIKVFNSLSKKKEELIAQKDNNISMYVCGPTVYGPAHIGHARTYIAFDIIRRYLEFRGFKVKLAINITDIHDDIISEALKQNCTIFELGEKFSKLFFEDMKTLKIKPANVNPKVTEHINDIIETIKKLKDKGFAYEAEDGVYFNVKKFKDYGKLARIKISKQKTGTRVQTDKYEKIEAQDFALWKKAKPNEPYWESPFGKGRPGWHIECSVMSAKHLGLPVDIHCGAKDLIFPHHENEIAQSEAAFEIKPFVRYWLHSGFLNVEGQKMSKSLGNFITIPDLLKKYDARVFRFFISQIHYRSAVNFTEKQMINAENTLKKLDNFIERIKEINVKEKENPLIKELIDKTRKDFIKAMDDDFNCPKAWAIIFEFESKINSFIDEKKLSIEDAKNVLNFLKELNEIFEVFDFSEKTIELSKEEKQLIELREKYRKQKNWAKADEIRALLKEKGIELIDLPDKVKWKKIV